jgi:hypothetical protein
MNYKKGIDQILQARRTEYALSLPIVSCLILALLANMFLSFLTPIFGVLAFVLFYRRRLAIARIPCPRCKEPFGTRSWLLLSSGSNKCTNCQLSIFDAE